MTKRARFFAILSMIIAATALGAAQKEKRRSAAPEKGGAAARPILHPVATSLPAIGGGWVPQGPAPILFGQLEGVANRPVVGAINAVVLHPTDPNTMWVGTVNGGVWKTTNATSGSPTWTPLTDGFSSLSVSALARDTIDPLSNTLVAGMGGTSSFGANGPVGSLLRTTDGGASWTALNPGVLANKNITGIAVRAGFMIVSTNGGCVPIYRSGDAGASFSAVSGVPSGNASHLATDPTSNAVLYAAIQGCFGNGLGGVYKSTDTGASWTRVSNAAMNNLFVNSSNSKIAVGNSGQVYVGIVSASQLTGLFRSGDGGASWTQLDTPAIHPGNQGYLHFSIAADPSNANLVYVGGDRQPDIGPPNYFPNPIGAFDYSGRLFRVNAAALAGSQATPLTHCLNATAACNNAVSTTSNSAPHADSRSMVFDASGNLIETDDGGIYRRSNPGGTGDWFSMIGNLQISEIHDVVYDHVSKFISSGNQDTGSPEQFAGGGSTWRSAAVADGGDVAADDMTLATQSLRYASTQNLNVFFRRTMNANGDLTAYIEPGLMLIGGTTSLLKNGQFLSPFELNRVDPRRILFAGATDLYESLDRGDTVIGLGLTQPVQAAVYGAKIYGNDEPDVIWAITSQFVYVRNSCCGPLLRTGNTPGGFLSDIAIDPADWTKVYVVNRSGQVFFTPDSGYSWTNVTGNLPGGTNDLRTIVYIPGSPNVIAVGGLYGVFRMDTGNPGVWNQFGTGLPNAIVFDLDYDPLDDVLVAGTVGRGAWKLSGIAASGAPPSLSINDVSVVEGNSGPVNATFTVSLSSPVGYTVGVNYATANGTATAGQPVTVFNSSQITINDVANASPYPSTINVFGLTQPVGKVTVTLYDFHHTFPDDVDVLLVGPGGQKVLLMSDAGTGENANGIELTFDDAAASQLPDLAQLYSGTYRPTDYEPGDPFGSPAPGGPYSTTLSAFSGTSGNGAWSLYVVDDYGQDVGDFKGGWSLTFSFGDYAPASGVLVFKPGQTSKTVSVSVLGDTAPEANETFVVNLSGAANATIADSQGVGTITNDDVSAPANVTATATTSTNVQVTWTAADGAASYRIYRSSGGGNYSQVGTASSSPFNDPTAAANTAYLYKVLSVDSSGTESPNSNVDLATTVMFTDPIVGSTSAVRKEHFTELLTAVNAVRALAGPGYPAISFTAPAPGTGVAVSCLHVPNLRNGLDPARSALGLPALSYTDPVLTGGSTSIKGTHITELRSGVR